MSFYQVLSLADLQDLIRRRREQACHLKARLEACRTPELRYSLRREINNTIAEMNHALCIYAQKTSGIGSTRMPCGESETGDKPAESA